MCGMLVVGLNLVRDLWSTLNDVAELGTGTTKETIEDTDLETVVASSETTDVTNTKTDQQLVKLARFHGTSAGSQSATEMIWKTQSPELAGSRIILPANTWNTSSDLTTETRWFWKGRRE